MKNIKLLHICSYYSGSKIYGELFDALTHKKEVVKQHVFSPNKLGLKSNKPGPVSIEFTPCLNLFTRLFYSLKQTSILFSFNQTLAAKVKALEFNHIHAHSLYSDGVLALYCYKRYNISYTVTVRGTDINLGEKYYAHWRWLSNKILRNAKHVVFLSPEHMTYYAKKYNLSDFKTTTIPNGIDPYWISNSVIAKRQQETSSLTATIRGLYIGRINKNKNLSRSISSFFSATNNCNSTFTIIGGTYIEYKKVFGEISYDIRNHVKFIPHTNDPRELAQVIRSCHLLIMPSISETFGLSYFESISQSTPIVYSAGQGVYGYFPEGYLGFSCDPLDKTSISNAISKTLSKFPAGLCFKDIEKNPCEDFTWESAAETMIDEAY